LGRVGERELRQVVAEGLDPFRIRLKRPADLRR
jgi:hypothetical protein